MLWYDYVLHFIAGAVLANGVPHFVQGICGNKFQTPFARPRGVGESSALVNVIWGWFNFIIGGVLLRLSFPPLPPPPAITLATMLFHADGPAPRAACGLRRPSAKMPRLTVISFADTNQRNSRFLFATAN